MSFDSRLLGPRVEAYGVDVLDPNEMLLGSVRERLSGSVEQNIDATIRGGMSISLKDDDIDWMKSRLRPWVWVNNVQWSLGVYLPALPSDRRTAMGLELSSTCLDKLSILDEFHFPTAYAVAGGAVVTDVVKSILLDIGEESMAITPSPLTVASLTAWPSGATGLRVINELLHSINYSAIWCDRGGRYRVEPYVLPGDRPVLATFQSGEAAIHSPNWTKTSNTSSPNRVIAKTQGTDDAPALESVAENHDPTDPYSYPSRGDRWVTKTYENVEAADQATLDAIALRYLNSSNPVASIEVSHAVVPLELGEIVHFYTPSLDTLASVNEYKLDLRVGAQMQGRWDLL